MIGQSGSDGRRLIPITWMLAHSTTQRLNTKIKQTQWFLGCFQVVWGCRYMFVCHKNCFYRLLLLINRDSGAEFIYI